MRKIIILLLTLLSLSVFGQTEIETIKKANDFIAEKKYETAFNLLDKLDPANDKPDVVLLKEDILLNYFVTSIMHQMFALTDINKDEDILDYRGKEGSFSMHMFQVDSILTRLTKIYPTNCKLNKGLADYYYEVHLKYGGRWLKDDKELFPLIQTNFQKAIDGNCADYLSYYVLGYINLVQEKNKECIPYFLKSIELNDKYASSHYNLAYAYLFTDDRENALKYAKNSLDIYNDREYKSDAARMVGQIYTELKDDKNVLTYYEMADKIDPENYYNIKPILNLYLKTNNKKANETTKAFFNLAPANPTIYNDLEEIYFSNKKDNELIDFYKSQSSEFKDDKKVQGSLNFYLARIYLETDKKVAKDYFIKAKQEFEKVFEKDHAVFNAIEEGLEQCEK
ncbi:tetratricopeptide repeat protein [Labilibaculum euxinus]